jgi:hypothetical protein
MKIEEKLCIQNTKGKNTNITAIVDRQRMMEDTYHEEK